MDPVEIEERLSQIRERHSGAVASGGEENGSLAWAESLRNAPEDLRFVEETFAEGKMPSLKMQAAAYLVHLNHEGAKEYLTEEHGEAQWNPQRWNAWWALKGLLLEDLIDAFGRHEVPNPVTREMAEAGYREDWRKPYQLEGELAQYVLRPFRLYFDSEADELPDHTVVLNRLAERFQGLDFPLEEARQEATMIDEDDWIQDYKVTYRLSGQPFEFSGQTKGDWYDCGHLLKSLSDAVPACRRGWELRMLDERGQDAVFHVGPTAFLDELRDRFGVAYAPVRSEPEEPVELSPTDQFLKGFFGK